jgi:hypothetical protein
MPLQHRRERVGAHGRLGIGAVGAAQVGLHLVPLRHHQHALVGVVVGAQPLRQRAQGALDAKAGVGHRGDVLEQREAPPQHEFLAAQRRHHVAHDDQERGAQQEAVQRKVAGHGDREVAHQRKQQRRSHRGAQPGPEPPPEGRHDNRKVIEKEEDAVGAVAEPDEHRVPRDVNPVLPGRQRPARKQAPHPSIARAAAAALKRKRADQPAVAHVQRQHRIGQHHVSPRLSRIHGRNDQRRRSQQQPHPADHPVVDADV